MVLRNHECENLEEKTQANRGVWCLLMVLVLLTPTYLLPTPGLDVDLYLSNLGQAEAGRVILRGTSC